MINVIVSGVDILFFYFLITSQIQSIKLTIYFQSTISQFYFEKIFLQIVQSAKHIQRKYIQYHTCFHIMPNILIYRSNLIYSSDFQIIIQFSRKLQNTFINIFLQMQSSKVKCLKGVECNSICLGNQCMKNPFLCKNQKCQCHSNHQKCQKKINWNIFKQTLSIKLNQHSKLLQNYNSDLQYLFKKIITELTNLQNQFKKISNMIGLSDAFKYFLNALKTNTNFNDVTGYLMFNIEKQFRIQNQFKPPKINKQRITNHIDNLIEQFKFYIDPNSQSNLLPVKNLSSKIKIDSKIQNNSRKIIQLFPTKSIQQINLLFRASQNDFDTNIFWEKCQGKKNTLTLIKTQFQKVIGGYTYLPLSKSFPIWKQDKSRQTFIFSLTQRHKIPLIEGKQKNALQSFGANFGPSFGQDIVIQNKANNRNNTSNIGYSYNNSQYILGNQQSHKKFVGQEKGNKYKISQWEVYQVKFEEQLQKQ